MRRLISISDFKEGQYELNGAPSTYADLWQAIAGQGAALIPGVGFKGSSQNNTFVIPFMSMKPAHRNAINPITGFTAVVDVHMDTVDDPDFYNGFYFVAANTADYSYYWRVAGFISPPFGNPQTVGLGVEMDENSAPGPHKYYPAPDQKTHRLAASLGPNGIYLGVDGLFIGGSNTNPMPIINDMELGVYFGSDGVANPNSFVTVERVAIYDYDSLGEDVGAMSAWASFLEEAIIARLLDTTPITDLVGNAITFVERPETDDLPGITLEKISPGLGGPAGMYHHGGRNDWQSPRVQFDCWAATPLEAKQVARALIAEMEQPGMSGSVAFDEGLLDSEADEPPETLDGGTKVFRVRVDMLVPWRALA